MRKNSVPSGCVAGGTQEGGTQEGPGRQDIGFVGLNCIFICLGTIPGWKSAVL